MKAEEIEQAAKEWADNFDSNIPEYGRIKQEVAELSYREACKFVNEKQSYSAEDMKSFGDFVFQNHHKRGFMDNSFDKLIELWEEKK